jgi:TonB-linked SusC/RagA family outer membrane protein
MKRKHCSGEKSFSPIKRLIMRLGIASIIIIGTTVLMANPTYSQTTNIYIQPGNKSIGQVLDEIEDQSGPYFVFNQKSIDVSRTRNIQGENALITETLPQVLEGTNIKPLFLDNDFAKTSRLPSEQQITITGRVVDDSGIGMPGVSVVIVGTTTGVLTDMDGNYSIPIPDNNIQLQFSFIGYLSQTVTPGEKRTIDIILEEDIQQLEEVVVVGYGTQTRRQITGSVSNVKSESFTKGITRVATDLLQGKVAGLMVNSGSGDVTKSSVLRLRGTTTLLSDEGPLIVIDGIPGGDLNTVSPSDIESMSVLKDATSAAIYGSRAAGGVILITTKKGSGGQTTVNYDSYFSVDKLANKPNLMNADEWRAYAAYSGKDPSVYDQYGADTDWFDELTRTGFSQNHNLSLSGGTNRSNYRASYTYQDRNGVMRDNSQTSHSFRLQTQQRALNDKLRIGLTASSTITDQKLPESGNYILAYSMLPVYPVYNEDGTYFTKVNAEYDQGNPVQNQDLNSKDNEMLYFYGTGDAQFTITEGLNIKANLYKSRYSETYSAFNDSRTEDGQGELGYAIKRNKLWNRTLSEWTIDFDKTVGNSKIQALGGYSWEYNTYSYFFARNRNFLSNATTYNAIQAGTGLKTGDVESYKESYTLISLFSRFFYSYLDKYMVTAMIRRDGSSKFGENNKWGLFPSVSIAWGISEESFMKNISWVDELKLRVGYGITGNQTGLSPYKTLQLYGTSGVYYNDGNWYTAYAINQNENPDLKWESTSTTNIGLDFSLIKGRFGGTLEWYNKLTTDMLYNYTVPTPPYVYSEMMANVGDMKNTGLEVLLNLRLFDKKNFGWDVSLNGSYNKNLVVSLSDEIYETERVYVGNPWLRGGSGVTSHVLEEGYPIGQFFMLECTEITNEGKYVFTDLNNDGNIDDSDRTYCGTALPDVIFGFNNTINYKNFDFSVFFRGTLGNDVFNNPRCAYANNTFLIGTNALNDDLIYKLNGQSSQICSFYVEDGSFVRLDNMSVGYTFNTSKISWLNKARVYMAGQNLFLLTKYTGLDPEVSLSGLAPGIEYRDFYPKSKTFTLGFNLTF